FDVGESAVYHFTVLIKVRNPPIMDYRSSARVEGRNLFQNIWRQIDILRIGPTPRQLKISNCHGDTIRLEGFTESLRHREVDLHASHARFHRVEMLHCADQTSRNCVQSLAR